MQNIKNKIISICKIVFTKTNIISGLVGALISLLFVFLLSGNMMPIGMNKKGSNEGMHKMGDMMNMKDMDMRHNINEDMMDMTMSDMVNDMREVQGRDLEKAFLAGMIPHHKGAVEMAQMLLRDPNVSVKMKDFAQQIISAQEKEIAQMKMWQGEYK